MLPSDIDTPDIGSIRLKITNPFGRTLEIPNFISYDYREHYLSMPCDAASFTVSEDSLSDDDRSTLVLGSKVEAWIEGQLQMTGFLDTLDTTAGPNGTNLTLEARSWISSMVDGHVDPKTQFSTSMTLDQFANAVANPFGVTVLDVDNSGNRAAISGLRGVRTSKKGKPLKRFVEHQEKPYPQEGAWAFLSRICQRDGLWLRAAADGKTIILTTPDFDQDPSYQLWHKTDDTRQKNNVLHSKVRRSREQQPTVIFASGVGGGGDFAKATLRGAIINPLIAPQSAAQATLTALLGNYPSVKAIIPPVPAVSNAIADFPYPDPNARPLFLYDPESHTQDQLNAFLRREMTLRMRKSLSAHYTILGHRLGGHPVAVDTIVDVQDDRSSVHIPLWVLGRRFQKSATAGTTSELELIRPGTIFFS